MKPCRVLDLGLILILATMIAPAYSRSDVKAAQNVASQLTNARSAIAKQNGQFRQRQVGEVRINAFAPGDESPYTITPKMLAAGGACRVTIGSIVGTPLEHDLYAAFRSTVVSAPRNYNNLDCRIAIIIFDQDGVKTLSVFIDPASQNAEVNGSLVHINDTLTRCIVRDLSKLLN